MNPAIRLLYAEDDPRDADLTRVHFAEHAPDFEIEIVGTGRECLRRVREHGFDLLLLDHRLPDMFGLDVLRELFHDGVLLPVVLVTGVGDEELVVQARRLGATAYIPKQHDYLERLPDRLRAVVEEYRGKEDRRQSGVPRTRILYIENQPREVELILGRMAEALPDYTVDFAGTCAEARAGLDEKLPYDMVVISLETPDLRGFDFLCHGKDRGVPAQPFIVVADAGDEESAVAALENGAADYVARREGYLLRLPHAIEAAVAHERVKRARVELMAELEQRKIVQHNLEERVKELRAFYALTKIVHSAGSAPEELYRELVNVLPMSWQYPEVACARIAMDGSEFRTPNYAESPWKLVAPVRVDGSPCGSIEVAYLEEKPAEDEGPFLKEERELIDDLADQTGRITRRFRAEKALRDSHERLSLALEGGGLGMWDWDLRNDAVIYSRSWAELLEYRPDELEPNASLFRRLIHPEDAPDVLDRLTAHVEGRTRSYASEHRLRTKSGKWLWVMDRGRVVERDKDGHPLRVAGIIADVSARKQAETELRLQSTALQAAANPILITDVEGTIVWTNAAFCSESGYAPGEVVGRNPRVLLRSGVHDAAFYNQMWQTILAGNVWQGELTNRRKDGSQHPEHMTITPVRSPLGVLSHFIAVKQDLTDDHKRQAAFLQAQKMESVGRLAGGVAHDFNNLLTVILSYADFIQEELAPDDPRQKNVEQILAAGRSAAELTSRLLAFSRQQVLERKVLSLNAVATATEGLLRRLIGEDIEFRMVLDPAVRPIRADRAQIEQVIMNLAVNARDAMPGGGKLTIETANARVDGAPSGVPGEASSGDYVALYVRDSGSGMDEKTKEHLFEPFFTTKECGKGTGLGLSTVHGIVTQSGGHIEVESRLGAGTTFSIYFPAISLAEEAGQPGAAQSASTRGTETLLLVDDNAAIRSAACDVLRRLGYNILEAADGPAAIEMAARYSGAIHLLLTDIVMPGMNGRQLADALRIQRPALRVLFMSGYTQAAVLEREILGSENALLHKPFVPSSLASKVREVLDAA